MTARPEADPQIGRTLGGQYRIEALLGAGGMGRVYRGRQLSVNRPVAIKVIAGQAPYPPEWVQRFRREAEATASLSHPNSVRLFDFGVTESEELFMVMELLEGSDLARQLQAHGPLPLVTALSIARQVLLALCEAHALGITHRDIKPDNIFLASVRGADVVAKVMDFGIAGLAHAQQRKSRLTGAGVIIGTPMYMSPEQAQGLPVDGKSDVYSLGVVLFEMLTGRPVFDSHTAVTLLLAHVVRPPMRLEEAGLQLPEQTSLQALLDSVLAKDPAHRPSAAEALETVTALSARLGIASATGTMRAISLAAPPSAAGRASIPGAEAARARTASGAGRETPPSAANHASIPGAEAARARTASGAARETPPPSAADRAWIPGAEAARPRTASGPGPETPPLATGGPRNPGGGPTPGGPGRELPLSAAGGAWNQGAEAAWACTASRAGHETPPSAAGDHAWAGPSGATGARRGAQQAASGVATSDPSGALLGTAAGENVLARRADAFQSATANEAALARDVAAFQSARAPSAPTGTQLRPGLVLLGAGLVLSAAGALALRWLPMLLDAAQSPAADEAHVATPAAAPAPRMVLINSRPSGASVLVDGEKIGTTPFQLELQDDKEISVARAGYVRQLVNVPYHSESPVLVKLNAQPDKAKVRERSEIDDSDPPFFFSFKQEDRPRVGPRQDLEREQRAHRFDAARPSRHEPITQSQRTAEPPAIEPVEPEPEIVRLPAADDVPEPPALEARAARTYSKGPERRSDEERAANALERARTAELAIEHGPALDDALVEPPAREEPRLPAAETSRSAATKIEAIREDEVAEIALDDDERAHVSKHYGFRALGRAVARAFGRLLIPYPNRERRAALAKMPLMYLSFREARAAYKHGEVDATGFQESVWQLRERRRQKIWTERDRYARGELSQTQYEARIDRIWDEFWGGR